MKPYYERDGVAIFHGDCRDVLPSLPPVESCVTDPPYGLEFMGKEWDRGVPGVEFWTAISGALLPGAPLLAFGGTRTFHRLACAIEDAGFEVRDCLSWLYGQGFPKSLDISKAIDKAAGAEREDLGRHPNWREGKRTNGQSMGAVPNEARITAPATDAARLWQGWGTALKPGHESILYARSPVDWNTERRTIAESLIRLEGRLWSLLPASVAVESLKSSPAEYDAACASAQWDASERQNTRDALFALTDTSRFELALLSSLSIVSSWRHILADASAATNTSTTGTGSSTTTDWQTLNSCVSALTLHDIILAEIRQPGSACVASPAAAYLSAAVANIASTRALSALGPVTSKAQRDFLDGAALAPDWTPILLAMRPLEGTFAENALRHGVAGLNIDGGRIGRKPGDREEYGVDGDEAPGQSVALQPIGRVAYAPAPAGRFPANVLLDSEAAAMLDEQSGESDPRPGRVGRKGGNGGTLGAFAGSTAGATGRWPSDPGGGASRFFYVAKASNADRGHAKGGPLPLFDQEEIELRNIHPTVKPTALLRYLLKLTATPTGGTVLDPFMGSGSTLVAAVQVGRPAIGIELEERYAEIAARRVEKARRGEAA